jgi:hypothetical protein
VILGLFPRGVVGIATSAGVATIRRGAPLDLRAADFRPYKHLRERASSGGVMNGRPAAPPPCLPAAMCTDKALGMFVTEANAAAIPTTLWWLLVDVVAGGRKGSASQAQLLILTPQ